MNHLIPSGRFPTPIPCFQVSWSMMRNWLAIALSVSNPPALKAKASLILAIVLKAFPFFGIGGKEEGKESSKIDFIAVICTKRVVFFFRKQLSWNFLNSYIKSKDGKKWGKLFSTYCKISMLKFPCASPSSLKSILPNSSMVRYLDLSWVQKVEGWNLIEKNEKPESERFKFTIIMSTEWDSRYPKAFARPTQHIP